MLGVSIVEQAILSTGKTEVLGERVYEHDIIVLDNQGSNALESTSASWCAFTAGSVFCQGESVHQDLPTGQLPTWVPLYMCGLEQVARSATRRYLGEDPRRCRSIDAKDAHRRCPPTEARTRAAPNSW